VVHWGSLEHGHYIAIVRKEVIIEQKTESKWFYCNDKNVGECDEKLALA